MTKLISASYALHRQKIAVQRTLRARSDEESMLAARWASAWHKLVQRKLGQDVPDMPAATRHVMLGSTLHGIHSFSMTQRPAPHMLH